MLQLVEHHRLDRRELCIEGQRGERRSQSTLRNLRSLVEDIRLDTGIRDLACWCYLTNAVLALAKLTAVVRDNRNTYKAYKKPEYRSYLRECGEIHRQWLRRHEPGLAVIMEARNLEPVEVKAGATGSLRSLHQFIREKSSGLAVRFNDDPPSLLQDARKLPDGTTVRYELLSLPLYLVGQTRRLIGEATAERSS